MSYPYGGGYNQQYSQSDFISPRDELGGKEGGGGIPGGRQQQTTYPPQLHDYNASYDDVESLKQPPLGGYQVGMTNQNGVPVTRGSIAAQVSLTSPPLRIAPN